MITLLLDGNQFTNIDVSKNLELEALDVGNNPITDLDLTNNTALESIGIKGLSIQTINNLPISATSFAVFPKLTALDVSYTPFTSLDFSNNPLINTINMEGTAITQLDISNLQLTSLSATNSQLTNLIYTYSNLQQNCVYIDIMGTPFEEVPSNVYSLIAALPDRRQPDEFGFVIQGRLYTSCSLPPAFLSMLSGKNWVVNP